MPNELPNELNRDHFEIEQKLSLGLRKLKANSVVRLVEYYSYGPSVQVCLDDDIDNDIDRDERGYWFSVRQTMSVQNKQYLLLIYPPSIFDGADKFPLALVELQADKKIRTLEEKEINALEVQAYILAMADDAINKAPLTAMLGEIPAWERKAAC